MKDNDRNVHNNHRKRLRYRYAREGMDNFEDHEILELLLQYPIRNGDTNETAHHLINELGSFGEVFDADIEDITAVKGIGNSSAVFIKLMRELFDYYIEKKNERGNFFRTVSSVAVYCVEQYRNIVEETYSVLLFDMSDRLLGFEQLHDCSYDNWVTIARAVGKHVFSYNANNFILVRNAMDGKITPSREEGRGCLAIKSLFSKFNRSMIEYFIITDNRYMPVYKFVVENYAPDDEGYYVDDNGK